MKRRFYPILALLLASIPAIQAAEFADYAPILGGTTDDQRWIESTLVLPAGVSSGTSGQSQEWPSGIAPVSGSSSVRLLAPVSGETTDFLSGGGIYSFFSATSFRVNSTTALSGVKSLILQIYIAEGLTGAFSGSAANLLSAPTLTLSGGTPGSQGTADFSLLQYNTTIVAPVVGTTTVDSLAYQWDLSGVSGTITGYEINWQNSYHSILFGVDVTQSTATHTSSVLQTIPEPSSWALLGIGMAGMAFLKRYRSKRRAE